MLSLLTLNYFIPFPSFPIAKFEQVSICWENYLIFHSFDICFNVSTEKQDLTRYHAGNSVVFPILHSQRDVTLTSLRLLKKFSQGVLESLYKCNHPPNFGDTKRKQEIAVNSLPRTIFHYRNA